MAEETPANEEDKPTREFVDRAIRERLRRPENLAELLADTVPELASRLVVAEMQPAPREFLVGNYRERESDLLYEIPYRVRNQQTTTLVCVMVEHQTRSDWQIPLKTYIYAAMYWEWQWRTYEAALPPKPEFRLTPVVPVVLSTGRRPWGSARRFRDLFAAPDGLEQYVPHWEPLMWELARRSVEELLNHPSVFLKSLAILKTDENDDYITATRLFESVYQHIEPVHNENHGRWSEAVQFMLGWSTNKRPHEERSQWHSYTLQLQEESARRREIEQMGQSIAQGYIEEGKEIGKEIGRQEGELRRARATLIRLGQRRLSTPSEAILQAINSLDNLARLDRMTDQFDAVASWDELLAIL